MTPLSKNKRRVRAKHKSTEGAVMLVVMLIIIVATATAAVSVASTTTEIAGVGRERVAMHARYAAEAAMVTTIAYLDTLGNSGTDLRDKWIEWNANPAPELREYGERPLTTVGNRHGAIRNGFNTQAGLFNGVMPLSAAQTATTGGTGGAGGTSGSGGSGGSAGGTAGAAPVDTTGSFGPRQAYQPAPYVVDLTDCIQAPNEGAPGTQIGGGVGLVPKQFYCVLTMHGAVTVPSGLTRPYSFDGLDVTQDVSGAMHHSRTTILTPTMLLPP